MFKKTHIKTILIFFIIGLFLITGLGIINVLNLNDIKKEIINTTTAVQIENRVDNLIKFTVFLDISYSLICIIMAIVLSKILNKPIIKLISDAEKIVGIIFNSNSNFTYKNVSKKLMLMLMPAIIRYNQPAFFRFIDLLLCSPCHKLFSTNGFFCDFNFSFF